MEHTHSPDRVLQVLDTVVDFTAELIDNNILGTWNQELLRQLDFVLENVVLAATNLRASLRNNYGYTTRPERTRSTS